MYCGIYKTIIINNVNLRFTVYINKRLYFMYNLYLQNKIMRRAMHAI